VWSDLDNLPNVWIVPIFSDGRIQLDPRTSERMFQLPLVKTALEAEPSPSILNDYQAKKIDVARAGRELSVGLVEIPVVVPPDFSGCSYVAVSVWVGAPTTAVDSLLIPIAIARVGEQTACSQESVMHLQGGFDALVAETSATSDARSQSTSVALHVFEAPLPGFTRSFAVFAAREAGESSITGWEMSSVLSEAIGSRGELPPLVLQARGRLAKNRTPEERASAYRDAAEVLKVKIFSGIDDLGQSERNARAALARLQAIAASTEPPITLLARFSVPSASGSDFYFVPLRLFAAPGAGIVAHDFDEIQPLAFQARRQETCIDRWTIVSPPDWDSILPSPATGPDEDGEDETDGEAPPARSWIANSIRSTDGLLKFLADTKPSPGPNAEGILLFAHHGDPGQLWLTDKDTPVQLQQIHRMFPPGSAAVLGACATASPSATGGLIRRLNYHQIDTIVASPFPVDIDYGQLMAKRIVAILDEAYAKNIPLTIGQLFRAGFRSAPGAPAGGASPGNDSDQMGLEFILAGDPGIHICKKEQDP